MQEGSWREFVHQHADQILATEPGRPVGEVICRSRLGRLLRDCSREAA